MKVLNLRCTNGHRFEGWFDNEDDFLAQNGAQRIECPLCEDRVIVKMPSAPRLNLSATAVPPVESASGQARPTDGPPAVSTPLSPQAADPQALQAMWMKAVRHVIANTEDVGDRFADEARKIHYGEAEQRGIRGQATPKQREALLDEGIDVAALPIPAGLKGPLQ
jgi:hypothetical protein